MILSRYLQEYIDIVKNEREDYPVCTEIDQLINMVTDCFEKESIYVDEEQAEKYLSYQKYFPYDLFPWEIFVFVLHNCTYYGTPHTLAGQLRWPILFIYVGRGAGKNGYLAFEDFCLLTKTNGIYKYNIDIFAMSEKQAKSSWQDVYDILEKHEKKMKKHFYWTKEVIVNLDTKSEFCFNTSSPKTKDGFRPGKVDFDEAHAYQNYDLMDVAITGLGKVPMPRRTIISTDGKHRGGVIDDQLEKGRKILSRERDDNGTIPFLCHIESKEEIDDFKCHHKANPSLRYLPHLQYEMKLEYADYKDDPIGNESFQTKRLNYPPMMSEANITSWDNVLATNQEIDYDRLRGQPCYAGIDYMKTTDFLGAGLLFEIDGKSIWVSHTWICKQSKDLGRIKAPLSKWESMGLVTYIDAPEIPADLPVCWLRMKEAELGANIVGVGIDHYRYQLMRNALENYGFLWDKKYGNIYMIRPSNEMMVAPIITSKFVNHNLVCGDNPSFRWQVWNTKMVTSNAGNITYGKIEPKSRKTDLFKAYVAAEATAMLCKESCDDIDTQFTSEVSDYGVMIF